MAEEIERKFLVNGEEYRKHDNGVLYVQGYLTDDPLKVIRVRIVEDQKAFFTFKGENNGIVRSEFEYEIPVHEAHELIHNFAVPYVIRKYRFEINHNDSIWVVDEFLDENLGLVIAEIELPTEDAPFEKPDWIGEEVSHDERYYNSYLSKYPYKDWK